MVPDDYQWLLVVVYAVFPQSHIWKLRLVPFKIYEWIIPFIITPFIWERWISYHRACPPFEDWQERAFTVGIGGPVGSGKILGAAQVSVLWMISMWNKQLIHGIWVDEWVYSLYRFYSFFVFNTGYTYMYIYKLKCTSRRSKFIGFEDTTDLPKSGSRRMRIFDRNLLKLGYNGNFKKYTINVKSLVPKYKHSTIKTWLLNQENGDKNHTWSMICVCLQSFKWIFTS